MAIAFKSKTDRSFGYTNTIGLTAPASIAAGDVLVAVIWIGWFGYTWNSIPSGWTKRIDKPDTAYGSFSMFTKTATGSESGTINFGHNNVNTAPGFGAMLCYSGVNTATPYDAMASSGLISSTNMVAPSVTAGASGKLLVCSWVNGNSSGFQSDIDEPGSMANRVDRYDTGQLEGFRSLCIADEAVAGGGATGTRTATQNNSNNGSALSFTLNEAAASSLARSFAVIAG